MANIKTDQKKPLVSIIGSGIGGLSCAVELLMQGIPVEVHEAMPYPGGCASTFFRQGYRFDAGATLAAGFAHGAVMDTLGKRWGIDWGACLSDIAMSVHIEGNEPIQLYTNQVDWKTERKKHFGAQAEEFWNWQEELSEMMWGLAMTHPHWPVRSIWDLLVNVKKLVKVVWGNDYAHLLPLTNAFFRSMDDYLPKNNPAMKKFIDGQLLISAQTLSPTANALYSSVALDISRQGVSTFPGGIGTIAEKLTEKIFELGGRVIFQNKIARVDRNESNFVLINTKDKCFYTDKVIFNTTPWNVEKLLSDNMPKAITSRTNTPPEGWGAFMLYLGVDKTFFRNHISLHHQIITGEDLAEGNSLFLSISPAVASGRAPEGQVAVTISTHTKLQQWWNWYYTDRNAYQSQKEIFQRRILDRVERVFPGFQHAVRFTMSGTPITFQFFTQRHQGWVGGFPQINMFQNMHPRLSDDLWIVGDSIFPGQSIPATALGGVRVAQNIRKDL
jgi:C-3',4' desaturase CrtD